MTTYILPSISFVWLIFFDIRLSVSLLWLIKPFHCHFFVQCSILKYRYYVKSCSQNSDMIFDSSRKRSHQIDSGKYGVCPNVRSDDKIFHLIFSSNSHSTKIASCDRNFIEQFKSTLIKIIIYGFITVKFWWFYIKLYIDYTLLYNV